MRDTDTILKLVRETILKMHRKSKLSAVEADKLYAKTIKIFSSCEGRGNEKTT